jgi:hypothetical protein
LQYHYGGRGIVSKYANVPLTTGGCVHKGVELLLRFIRSGIEPSEQMIDKAVSVALEEYTKVVGDSGIQVGPDEDSKFVFRQEQAKTEALVRAWSIAEMPHIIAEYDVISVEQELCYPLDNARGILLQARIDAVLKVKQQPMFLNYSLKTMKDYRGEKTDLKFEFGLQTITEQWATQKYFAEVNQSIAQFEKVSTVLLHSKPKVYENLRQFNAKYFPKFPEKMSGTKHCFLLKGAKAKYNEDTQEWQAGDSPLVRGFRKPYSEGGDMAYAHSYYFPNSANKSGKGALGTSWERFNVWEVMSIKEWLEMLSSRVQDHTGKVIPEIQPECGDVIKSQVVTPSEVWKDPGVIDSTLVQIGETESRVRGFVHGKKDRNNLNTTYGTDLDYEVPMNLGSCFYPTSCEYLPICHGIDYRGKPVGTKPRENPMENGYTWRVPHHPKEKEELCIK